MKQTILIISVALTLFSCSNGELSRVDAKEQIIEYFQYPNVELKQISFESFGKHSKIPKGYDKLVTDGYLTYKDKQYKLNFYFTPKSEPYLLKEKYISDKFVSNLLEFDNVTGIKVEEPATNVATVHFNLKRTGITAFGEFAEYNEGDIIEKTATFEKFDDGWRIVSKKPEKILTRNDFRAVYPSQSLTEAKLKLIKALEQSDQETILKLSNKSLWVNNEIGDLEEISSKEHFEANKEIFDLDYQQPEFISKENVVKWFPKVAISESDLFYSIYGEKTEGEAVGSEGKYARLYFKCNDGSCEIFAATPIEYYIIEGHYD